MPLFEVYIFTFLTFESASLHLNVVAVLSSVIVQSVPECTHVRFFVSAHSFAAHMCTPCKIHHIAALVLRECICVCNQMASLCMYSMFLDT